MMSSLLSVLLLLSGAAWVSAQTCDQQLDNMACSGQFGNEECYSCRDRISWLKSPEGGSKSDNLAKTIVGREFRAECGACYPGDAPELSKDGYTEVFRDDFEGNGAVDSSKWEHIHEGHGFGNNEEQFYTPREENSWVSEGTLKIRARLEDYNGRRFTSAKLQTRADWLYGKFSVRARLHRGTGRGTWAANWMMPRVSHYGIWPHSGEIDIMEHVGYDTGRIHGTVHTGCCHHSIGTQVGGSTTGDMNVWHEYTVEWRENLILFAMDGNVYQTYEKQSDDAHQWPFNQNFYIILNMAVGGNWGGQQGIDDGAFGGEGQIMEIDWVVVEQRGNNGSPPGDDNSPPADDCGKQMGNMACSGSECYSCGDRIAWLQSPGGGSKSASAARDLVAREFPSECGACASDYTPLAPTPPPSLATPRPSPPNGGSPNPAPTPAPNGDGPSTTTTSTTFEDLVSSTVQTSALLMPLIGSAVISLL